MNHCSKGVYAIIFEMQSPFSQNKESIHWKYSNDWRGDIWKRVFIHRFQIWVFSNLKGWCSLSQREHWRRAGFSSGKNHQPWKLQTATRIGSWYFFVETATTRSTERKSWTGLLTWVEWTSFGRQDLLGDRWYNSFRHSIALISNSCWRRSACSREPLFPISNVYTLTKLLKPRHIHCIFVYIHFIFFVHCYLPFLTQILLVIFGFPLIHSCKFGLTLLRGG